jgi:hypothetical protein
LDNEHAAWFLEQRGVTPGTLDHFKVHVRSDGAVVFPYVNGEKVRKGIPSGEREFFFTSGVKPALYNAEDANKPQCFLVEGETDTMRLWQEAGSDEVGVLGLSGIESWRDEMVAAFERTDRVWVILDNDKDYNVAGRVDTAWRNIRASLGRKAHRVRLPRDVKDVCEFFHVYDLDTLRLLCTHKGPSESRYHLLDLTAEPPPVRWLVDGLMCRGDLHLLMGDPNLGKSWLTLDLALAIASGRPTWIGRDVTEQGRVLYIDEENPEDLVYDRLIKLGMTKDDAKNIRYINNEGIRLDRNVDELIDESLEFDPTLIVVDAMRRIHSADENSAGDMNKLFNDGIKPLARDTGAAVVMIHHSNKMETNSSFKRAAGSGDISAGVDWAFDVRGVGVGALTLAVYKSRRKPVGDVIHVAIRDTTEGGVELVGTTVPEPLF